MDEVVRKDNGYSLPKREFFQGGRMARAGEFKIIEGPSKFDLMLSLFDGSSKPGNRRPQSTVKFRTEDNQVIVVKITAVERGFDSGEDFLFRGFAVFERSDGLKDERAVTGFRYSTRTRKGLMELHPLG